jgi:hypothetical protein
VDAPNFAVLASSIAYFSAVIALGGYLARMIPKHAESHGNSWALAIGVGNILPASFGFVTAIWQIIQRGSPEALVEKKNLSKPV